MVWPPTRAATLYAACLSRRPSEHEASAIAKQLAASDDIASDLADLFWALLNSNEFIFNHETSAETRRLKIFIRCQRFSIAHDHL